MDKQFGFLPDCNNFFVQKKNNPFSITTIFQERTLGLFNGIILFKKQFFSDIFF